MGSMTLKRGLKWLGGGVLTLVGLAFIVVAFQILSFNREAARVYQIEPLNIKATMDSAVIARGQHLAESFGGCLGCHGQDLSGSLVDDLGPIGVMRAPNLTSGAGGVGAAYTDGELARAIRHGIRADGRSLIFMPTQEFNWWSDDDIAAVVSFVRSMPPVDATIEPTKVRPFGKVLRQFGVMELLSAKTVDHAARETAPMPEPTSRYGEFLARGCSGCHGERLSGGRIPGAPKSLPIPANLTPHETGLGGWTKEQFFAVLNTGIRPDGRRLADFMPIGTTRAMNEIEKTALWEYLRSVEPLDFGNR